MGLASRLLAGASACTPCSPGTYQRNAFTGPGLLPSSTGPGLLPGSTGPGPDPPSILCRLATPHSFRNPPLLVLLPPHPIPVFEISAAGGHPSNRGAALKGQKRTERAKARAQVCVSLRQRVKLTVQVEALWRNLYWDTYRSELEKLMCMSDEEIISPNTQICVHAKRM
jgi:hypothetical protein